MGEFEMTAGSLEGGRARLRELEREARGKGFELIARKAGAVAR
jgi:hypothetical protein